MISPQFHPPNNHPQNLVSCPKPEVSTLNIKSPTAFSWVFASLLQTKFKGRNICLFTFSISLLFLVLNKVALLAFSCHVSGVTNNFCIKQGIPRSFKASIVFWKGCWDKGTEGGIVQHRSGRGGSSGRGIREHHYNEQPYCTVSLIRITNKQETLWGSHCHQGSSAVCLHGAHTASPQIQSSFLEKPSSNHSLTPKSNRVHFTRFNTSIFHDSESQLGE